MFLRNIEIACVHAMIAGTHTQSPYFLHIFYLKLFIPCSLSLEGKPLTIIHDEERVYHRVIIPFIRMLLLAEEPCPY